MGMSDEQARRVKKTNVKIERILEEARLGKALELRTDSYLSDDTAHTVPDKSGSRIAVRTPSEGHQVDESARLDGAVLTQKILQAAKTPDRYPKGIEIRHAWIDGDLNFLNRQIPFPLQFVGCYFSNQVVLQDAETKTVSFRLCRLDGILGRRLKAQGDFVLHQCRIDRPVVLHLATIAGVMDAQCSEFASGENNPPDVDDPSWLPGFRDKEDYVIALNLTRVQVGGSCHFRRLRSDGAVQLNHARIGRHLDLREARISAGDLSGEALAKRRTVQLSDIWVALKGAAMTIRGHFFLMHSTIYGQVRMPYVRIKGDLFLRGAWIDGLDSARALNLNSAKIRGEISTGRGLEYGLPEDAPLDLAEPECRPLGKRIRETLEKCGFQCPDDPNGFFIALGAIRFRQCEVGGDVNLSDVILSHDGFTDAYALWADGITVNGKFILSQLPGQNGSDKTAQTNLICGSIGLRTANLAQGLEIQHTKVIATDETIYRGRAAIDASHLKCGARVHLLRSHIIGTLRVDDATIEGSLLIQLCDMEARTTKAYRRVYALMGDRMKVGAQFAIEQHTKHTDQNGDLNNAEARPYVIRDGISIVDATIEGSLRLYNGEILTLGCETDKAKNRFGWKYNAEEICAAVHAQGIRIRRNLEIDDGFQSTGCLNFSECHIQDDVIIKKSRLVSDFPSDGKRRNTVAFGAARARIGGSVFLGIEAVAKESQPPEDKQGETDAETATLPAPEEKKCGRNAPNASLNCDGRLVFAGAQVDGFFRMHSLMVKSALADEEGDIAFSHLAINLTLATIGRDLYTRRSDPVRSENAPEDNPDTEAGDPDKAEDKDRAAAGVRPGGDLPFVTVHGGLSLQDATVHGSITLSEVRLYATEIDREDRIRALEATGLKVFNSAHFGPNFIAQGLLDLRRANIEGHMEFTGLTADFVHKPSKKRSGPVYRYQMAGLDCSNISVGLSVKLNGGSHFEGPVLFVQAHVQGDFLAGHTAFEYGPRPDDLKKAVTADPSAWQTISGVVSSGLDQLGWQRLDISKAPDLSALNLSSAVIGRDLSLTRFASFNGNVIAEGAHIGDDLEFWVSSLDHEKNPGVRFCGNLMVVKGVFYWNRENVKLLTQQVESRDRTENPGKLSEDSRQGNIILLQRMERGAQDPGSQDQEAEDPQNSPEYTQPGNAKALIQLTGARVGTLADVKSGWPAGGYLHIDGFVYDHLLEDDLAPKTHRDRLDWLKRQPRDWEGALPQQPYEHLVRLFQRLGKFQDAEEIDVARLNIERQRNFLTLRMRPFGTMPRGGLFGVTRIFKWIAMRIGHLTIRYGYQPWRAAGLLLLLWIFGAFVYQGAYEARVMLPDDNGTQAIQTQQEKAQADKVQKNKEVRCMTPAQEEAHVKYTTIGQNKTSEPNKQNNGIRYQTDPKETLEYPPFNSIMYSLDTLIPIVEFRQTEYWIVNTIQQCKPAFQTKTPGFLKSASHRLESLGTSLRDVPYLDTLLGAVFCVFGLIFEGIWCFLELIAQAAIIILKFIFGPVHWLWLYQSFHIAAGWVLSTLFVAAVTGLVRPQMRSGRGSD